MTLQETKAKEKMRAHQWYLKNKVRHAKKRKEYYEKNKEQIKQWNREYYQQNKERISIIEKERYERNKPKILQQHKEWYQKNHKEIRERRRLNPSPWQYSRNKLLLQRRHNHKRRMLTLQFFGGKCQRCGNTDYRCLQIDHINGGGSIQFRNNPGKVLHIQYRLIRDNPEEARKLYQLLCANCNWIKRWENKEYSWYRGEDGTKPPVLMQTRRLKNGGDSL